MDKLDQLKFHAAILAALPNLRRYSIYLTRNISNAEDLTQQTILIALSKQHTYTEINMVGWLLNIAHNFYIEKRRKSKRQSNGRIDMIAYHPRSKNSSPELSAIVSEIGRELKKMPTYKRNTFINYAIFGESREEAATKLNTAPNTVATRTYRIRAELRQKFQ